MVTVVQTEQWDIHVERSPLQEAPNRSSQDKGDDIILRVWPLQVKLDLRVPAGQSQQEGPPRRVASASIAL